jgi:hypothetical protein
MPASFWFDQRNARISANGWPEAVLKGLDGNLDGRARSKLEELLDPRRGTFNIPADYALYMSGTADELRSALLSIYLGGLRTFSFEGDPALWYIKGVQGSSDKIVMCIAGRGDSNKYYWHVPKGASPADSGLPASYWAKVPAVVTKGQVTIKALFGKILPELEQAPFKKKVLPPHPPLRWLVVEEMLDRLDQGTDGKKRLRCKPGGDKLYVHGDSSDSPEEQYAAAVRLIKNAIDKEFRPGTSDRVFNIIGIKDERNGLKVSEIKPLRYEMAKAWDAIRFAYARIAGSQHRFIEGHIYTLCLNQNFFVMRTHDKVKSTNDQSTWAFTGDKVHLSVDPAEIEAAWDVVLPILIAHHGTFKEFKLTDMELVKASVASDDAARRIYHGAQISIYFHAAAGDEGAAARRFAKVLKEVSLALQHAIIGVGEQPPSDVRINDFVSFRHDLDDLIDRKKAKTAKQQFNGSEDEYRQDFYMSPRDETRYPEHMKLMLDQPLCQALLQYR